MVGYRNFVKSLFSALATCFLGTNKPDCRPCRLSDPTRLRFWLKTSTCYGNGVNDSHIGPPTFLLCPNFESLPLPVGGCMPQTVFVFSISLRKTVSSLIYCTCGRVMVCLLVCVCIYLFATYLLILPAHQWWKANNKGEYPNASD